MNISTTYIQRKQRRIAKLVTTKFKQYYLTGGTALAFYFKHRFSEDLDFFSQKYDRENPEMILKFISQKTGFAYKLESEQKRPGLVPMKVFFLELKRKEVLKVDFVQDFAKNIKPIRKGLHSIEDIYYRKILAAIGARDKESATGRVVATGRQSVKDLFDIYYLSTKYKSLSKFFFKYFAHNHIERLNGWYKGFNRMEAKLELIDLVVGVDTSEVFKHLDDQILKEIPDQLL